MLKTETIKNGNSMLGIVLIRSCRGLHWKGKQNEIQVACTIKLIMAVIYGFS